MHNHPAHLVDSEVAHAAALNTHMPTRTAQPIDRTPVALSIAGSDSGGGAGIQADLRAFARCGVHGTTAVTAITVQNTVGVRAVHVVPPELVLAQVRAVVGDIGVDAVKIGMLGTADTARAVACALDELPAGTPVVVDPVMVAESGARLLEPSAQRALIEEILPRATVATPNLPEARALAAGSSGESSGGRGEGSSCGLGGGSSGGRGEGSSGGRGEGSSGGRGGGSSCGLGGGSSGGPGEGSSCGLGGGSSGGLGDRDDERDGEAEDLARAVLGLGPRIVVLTGGHRERAVDLFIDARHAEKALEIPGVRHPDGAAHGSGCTHSSTLAAALALGQTPLEAARTARRLAGEAVARGLRDVGAGAGPVDVLDLRARRGAIIGER